MFKIISPRCNFLPRYVSNESVKRLFLSNAYKCEEAWANRLKNVVFEKTPPINLYHDLDACFESNKRVSPVDVDLLLSHRLDGSFKNEVDDVLLRLRVVPESGIVPERTTHAAIRWYIEHASKEDLLNVLSDRLNYGLFPDHYLTNLLMDRYLKQKDALSAVKIAVLQMLQEDLDHPIMKVLALHCCYNYLESPDVWRSYKEPEPDPDEEVVKVRVKFLRNPYFDDHFDIMDTNHLVGKTLWLFGRIVDGPVGTSSQLIGLVLYEKYDKCADFLEKVIREGRKVHAEAVEKAREYTLKRPKQVVEENAEGAATEGRKEDGKEGKQGEVKEEAKMEDLDENKTKVLKLLEQIEGKNLEKGNLLSVTAELVRQVVKENESKDIKHQCEVYKQWEKDREKNIEEEMEKNRLDVLRSEIEKTKQELEKEEERIFFFDNEEEMKYKAAQVEQKMAKVVFYKGKRKNKEDAGEDDYISPNPEKKF